MNIVFIGSSHFGLRCLECCLSLPQIQVVGVVTAPETFSISYRPTGVRNVLYADIGSFTKDHSLSLVTLKRSMNETGLLEIVEEWEPDLFLVAGWYHIIPKAWRAVAPAYGLHASLLPDYSGGAPLVWSMINGEKKTGITLFQMDDGVDCGPIAGQKEEPIYSSDQIGDLYSRIEQRGLELIKECIPKIANGSVELIQQNETNRRIMPQRGPEDGVIDWNLEAEFIERFIRAQTRPYPGAFSTWNEKKLHIWSSKLAISCEHREPGRVYLENCKYIVGCSKDAIQLNEITYGNQTFSKSEISELFGGGGQKLGESMSY